jgi:hypothetical protein
MDGNTVALVLTVALGGFGLPWYLKNKDRSDTVDGVTRSANQRRPAMRNQRNHESQTRDPASQYSRADIKRVADSLVLSDRSDPMLRLQPDELLFVAGEQRVVLDRRDFWRSEVRCVEFDVRSETFPLTIEFLIEEDSREFAIAGWRRLPQQLGKPNVVNHSSVEIDGVIHEFVGAHSVVVLVSEKQVRMRTIDYRVFAHGSHQVRFFRDSAKSGNWMGQCLTDLNVADVQVVERSPTQEAEVVEVANRPSDDVSEMIDGVALPVDLTSPLRVAAGESVRWQTDQLPVVIRTDRVADVLRTGQASARSVCVAFQTPQKEFEVELIAGTKGLTSRAWHSLNDELIDPQRAYADSIWADGVRYRFKSTFTNWSRAVDTQGNEEARTSEVRLFEHDNGGQIRCERDCDGFGWTWKVSSRTDIGKLSRLTAWSGPDRPF